MARQEPNEKLERAFELRSLLNKACHAYYILDKPFLKDNIYDSLYRELRDIEKENPKLITQDSPTQRIGGLSKSGFKKTSHKIPLHSLDNAFNLEEVNNWIKKIIKLLSSKGHANVINDGLSMIGELKIDGNAIALSYSNGLLQKAATRGNGLEGEDITNNIRTINSIPLRLLIDNPPPWVEIRGEAYIPSKVFEFINNERKLNGDDIFANPRNACAGTLRQLNPQIVASRQLDFFAYTIHLPDSWIPTNNDPTQPRSQWESLAWLKKAGFKVNPEAKLLENIHEVNFFFEQWNNKRHQLPYDTDGVVLKLNEFKYQELVGFTQKAPRWAIALKYEAEEAATKLLKLSYQVGRTGAITPIAEFKPVVLAGTKVSRATLHNAKRITSLDLHTNDSIIVRKAGEIIPEVVRVVIELREKDSRPLSLPNSCPICSSVLIQEENVAATKCSNSTCPAIIKGKLLHWASKDSMDIDGLGSKLIDKLVDENIVSSVADIYKLTIKQLSELEGMGTKLAVKVIESIEVSKKNPWHKQLYGLGIQHIGNGNAKVLSKYFKSADELLRVSKAEPERITSIFGIGKEIATSLAKWKNDPSNEILLESLKNEGISLKGNNSLDIDQYEKIFMNQIFVLTGSFSRLSRREAEQKIELAGGKVSSSISQKTNYLIAGNKPGSKIEKAKKVGVKILNENQFRELLQTARETPIIENTIGLSNEN